jgi:transcriptional regulator with XRE-family HTH domain
MVRLGRTLRLAREAQGLRQDELALATGVSTRTVHAVENGKLTARVDVIIRMANGLGLDLVLKPPDGRSFPGAAQS